LGTGHSIGRRGRADHEARCRENAEPVGGFYGLVDLARASEIVCGDDQRLQRTISRRSRRK
jgi:hypothetical protein